MIKNSSPWGDKWRIGRFNADLLLFLPLTWLDKLASWKTDTDGTVAAWQDAREDVIKPNVANHSGKIVKFTDDGFLFEFSTVQDAVTCAIVMQHGLATNNLDFRIGVNLGDIVENINRYQFA
jgi:class 3 adenylate cyclase